MNLNYVMIMKYHLSASEFCHIHVQHRVVIKYRLICYCTNWFYQYTNSWARNMACGRCVIVSNIDCLQANMTYIARTEDEVDIWYSINDCFERNSCFYTLKGRLELCYWPRRAEGNSPIVTFPRAYKNNYFSNIKAVINTFICRKQKSQLMTPPWPFSSLSARLFFMSVSLRVD